MFSKDGEHIVVGEYKEIIPNKKLQFTWAWQVEDTPDTLVTLEFQAAGKTTKLILIHENFLKKEAAEKHNMGWIGCLDHLTSFLQT